MTHMAFDRAMDSLVKMPGVIAECIDREEWKKLVFVLAFRQCCLESLWSDAKVVDSRVALLSREILEQDASFIERVQARKKIQVREHLAFERNSVAIKAYQQP